MRTAEEWIGTLVDGSKDEMKAAVVIVSAFDIRAIQADALRHAVDLAKSLNDGHDWPISRQLEAEAAALEKEKK